MATKQDELVYIGNRLSQKGRNVTSIETLGTFLEKEGYIVHKASSKKNQFLRLADMCSEILRNRKCADVVLIDTYSTLGFWFAYIAAKICKWSKLPYIPILRGGDLPKRLKSNPKLSQELFAAAKVNVAPSAYLMHYFKKAGFTNLVYIPNTIEIKNYPFKVRKNIAPKLLWVRAFADIYNPMLALKVLENLLAKHPDAELSMVGPFKDNSIETCKAYAEKKRLPVTFTGGMPKEKWLAYAKDFDIFINTTNVDNTPVSVIEAMALGLPVVSTNVGGLPFLLEDKKDAILVPPKNTQAFTEGVKVLLENQELAQSVAKKARKKAESFDWESVKYQWDEMLGSR
ncbi:glycosyltransferase family 4 protein [Haloflavibacter putidus]|uniref:Glycosyltransferase n=1 Tax=Haloflavibacter putidus TaxID=2576776 RepID=A0A507ZJC9_9FLAO|nr:glycosyltransferase [Haloflavibacter putidus]TQD33832.1 glycosyltransferase [Haloflavibacter putidus]